MNLVYIHGHAASPNCFGYIRSQLRSRGDILLGYSSEHGFWNNHADMLAHLEKKDHLFFVAHSLGGIHALHLAKALGDRVIGAVTISTPYGGSIEAGFLQFLAPFQPVLRDISPFSKAIADAHRIPIAHPWTNIVTTHGHHPFTMERNDGVVALSSMRRRADMEMVELPLDHWQVLRSPQTVAVIRNAMKSVYVHSNPKPPATSSRADQAPDDMPKRPRRAFIL
jgi:pimeloyl-ACP methyl ester carboxylesterase